MNTFEQQDYKVVLRHHVEALSKTERGVYRKMAEHLGVNPSLVSQIMTGPKDFTEEQTVGVCEFLGLAKLESRYVLSLVQASRAGSYKLKAYHLEHLEEIRRQALDLSKRVSVSRTLSEQEQAKFYSSWIFSAVQLLTTLDKAPSFQDIANKFHIDPKEAQEIVSFLLEIGMIIEERGVYKPGLSISHIDRSSPYIVNFRRNWRIKALQMAEKIREDEIMYSCNFSVNKKDFALIREQFVQMIQKFLVTAQASPAEDLAQFNLDLFWLRG